MTQPNFFPMPVVWANIDDMVDQYVEHLVDNQMTSSDVAMGLLAALDGQNRTLVLAMTAATTLQRLAAQRRRS